MGYSRKKQAAPEWLMLLRTYTFLKTPTSSKLPILQLETTQNCVTPLLRNSTEAPKTKTPGNSTNTRPFLDHTWKFHSEFGAIPNIYNIYFLEEYKLLINPIKDQANKKSSQRQLIVIEAYRHQQSNWLASQLSSSSQWKYT